ncbi:conserved Plasmodium protein, unknown function [Plasmodium gonderi]|uniref:Uncharacterized protein n=1 Tax=Plasmodium gonderi TaxID=77519 RepID=A0A1Y1JH94_PLAGO|nr:conserved Plasmodium protein, unknown function [Plasmodium gonderi]GAW81891.1 conserved Plasmodium protein, unknown function [Plasmodium gonderi]
MKKAINWCAFIILGTFIPLGLSTFSLCYLNIDKEKNQIHSYNNEYRRKQRELLKSQQQQNKGN